MLGDGACILGSDLQADLIGRARGVAPSNHKLTILTKRVGRLVCTEMYMTMMKMKGIYGPWMNKERCLAPASGASTL